MITKKELRGCKKPTPKHGRYMDGPEEGQPCPRAWTRSASVTRVDLSPRGSSQEITGASMLKCSKLPRSRLFRECKEDPEVNDCCYSLVLPPRIEWCWDESFCTSLATLHTIFRSFRRGMPLCRYVRPLQTHGASWYESLQWWSSGR